MQTLATSFRHNGFNFDQIKRRGDIALFRKMKPHFTVDYYEVVIVQKHGELKWPNGSITPPGENMPSNEQWGTKGWSYDNQEDAEMKFLELA